MNLKKLTILTVVLFIGAAITYKLNNADNAAPTDPRVGTPLLQSDALEDVTRILLRSGTVTLTFENNDGQWTFAEYHDLPVKAESIARLVRDLKDITLLRVASVRPERIDTFGFGVDHISFEKADGSTTFSLWLGDDTDNGKQLVKLGDESIAFLANKMIYVDGYPGTWFDTRLIDFDAEAARRISLSLDGGASLELSRESADGPWTTETELPEGKQLDADAINALLGRLSAIDFMELAKRDAEDATDPELKRKAAIVLLEDGTRYEVTLSQRPERTVTQPAPEDSAEGTEPVEQTIEAGPVYLSATTTEAGSKLDTYMEATAFTVEDYLFERLPDSIDALLEDSTSDASE